MSEISEVSNVNNLAVLEMAVASLCGLFLLAAAVAEAMHRVMIGRETIVKDWFSSWWLSVHNGPWLCLPELAVRHTLNAKVAITRLVIATGQPRQSLLSVGFASLLISATGFWVFWGSIVGVATIVSFSGFVLVSINLDIRENAVYRLIAVIVLGIFHMSGALIWIVIALDTNIILSALIMLLTFPTVAVSVSMIVYGLSSILTDSSEMEFISPAVIPAFAMSSSFFITFLALTIGNSVDSRFYLPQTPQMLISNVFFDGLTMVVTFALLSWSVLKPGVLRIPVAIGLDVLVAGVLACSSLYFGLVFTVQSLSVPNTVNILFAKSPDGGGVELSPFFWAMHTTFLPTIGYVSMILLAWVGKSMLMPVVWTAEMGADNPKPLHLTSGLLAVVAIFFAIIEGVLQVAK